MCKTKYTILKGWHYSNFIPSFHCVKPDFKFEGTYSFNDNCKYSIDEKSCVNKLFGFCFGLGVHTNSVRFGWTYNEEINNIYIWGYIYKNGTLHKVKIFTCNLNEEHHYKIEVHRISENLGTYTFKLVIDNDDVLIFQEMQSDSCFVTTLGPYFGGNTRAPHKMEIIKK